MIYFIYMYRSKFLDVVLGNKFVVGIAKYGLAMYLSHQFVWYFLYKSVGIPTFWSMVIAIVFGFFLGWLYSKIEGLVKGKN